LVTIVTVYVLCGSSRKWGADRCPFGLGAGTGTFRHAAEDGADVVVDDVDAVVDAEPLAAAPVDTLWLVLLPQPAATRATVTIRQAGRTAH
jgi:hypothetical protein